MTAFVPKNAEAYSEIDLNCELDTDPEKGRKTRKKNSAKKRRVEREREEGLMQ